MSFALPSASIALNTGKALGTEYHNGPKTRIVTLCVTCTAVNFTDVAHLYGCVKITAGVGQADLVSEVGVDNFAAVTQRIQATLTFGVPPLYYYKAIKEITGVGTDVTLITGSWTEIDI